MSAPDVHLAPAVEGAASGPAPVRVGVVGAGAWAALAHIPAILAHPHAELVGIADRDPSRLAKTADAYMLGARFADHRELIAAGLDALVVATPPTTHHSIARDALDAGLHVLVEKPLTVSADDARDLESRARAAALHLLVGYTLHYMPGTIAARELIRSGDLGEITLIAGIFASSIEDLLAGAPDADGPYARATPIGAPSAGTYADPALAGGGQGQSQATHALEMALHVTGLRPRRVTALMTDRGGPVDVVDAFAYELDNGALGTLAATGLHGADQPPQQELRYFGTCGALLQDLATGRVELHRTGEPPRELAPAVSEDDTGIAAAPVSSLVDLIHGTGENRSPAGPAVAAVELLEAAYRSAADGGRPVLTSPDPEGPSTHV